MTDTVEMLNRLCRQPVSVSCLNALHACRPGHPWNATAVQPFNNAWALVAQDRSWIDDSAAYEWLREQASKERINTAWEGWIRSAAEANGCTYEHIVAQLVAGEAHVHIELQIPKGENA